MADRLCRYGGVAVFCFAVGVLVTALLPSWMFSSSLQRQCNEAVAENIRLQRELATYHWALFYAERGFKPLPLELAREMPPPPRYFPCEKDPTVGYMFQWQRNDLGELLYRRVGKSRIRVEVKDVEQ